MLNVSSDRLPPDAQPTDAFRQVMRGCASSVAIVSSAEDGVAAGIVATAVMSVAMEPPALVVCINRSSSCHALLMRRRAFTVNFLSSGQAGYASQFHRSKAEDRFRGEEWAFLNSDEAVIPGLPFLVDAQASVFCWAEEPIEAYTHTLFIGCVAAVRLGHGVDPLLYCEGRYGRFEVLQGEAGLVKHEEIPDLDGWIDHFNAKQTTHLATRDFPL